MAFTWSLTSWLLLRTMFVTVSAAAAATPPPGLATAAARCSVGAATLPPEARMLLAMKRRALPPPLLGTAAAAAMPAAPASCCCAHRPVTSRRIPVSRPAAWPGVESCSCTRRPLASRSASSLRGEHEQAQRDMTCRDTKRWHGRHTCKAACRTGAESRTTAIWDHYEGVFVGGAYWGRGMSCKV